MHIRPTRPEELDEVMAIYAHARRFMAAHGNPNQWGPTCWPPRELIAADIAAGKSHVCINDDGRIAAVFFYDYGPQVEPTYNEIEGGSWLSSEPYGVVHRIASAGITPGAGRACLSWALEQSPHLRIDTHADNHVLQSLLAKMGFAQRGIIYVYEDRDPRLAYERTAPQTLEATVLVENHPAPDLLSEHGLSAHIRFGELRVLLDFGQSDAFARNADTLGIDLARVDHAVLSHAHYDHADGMTTFLARNDHAPVHLSAGCAENCWSTKGGTSEAHYIGIAPGTLAQHQARLAYAATDRVTTVAEGVHLVPHTTAYLADVGQQAGMLLREGDRWVPDSFAHEMSLVFEAAEGLVIFSSCSHAGIEAIVGEVRAAFPDRHIAAFVGGLHLVHADDEAILHVAEVLRKADIGQVFTGHCTGERACELLQRELLGRVSTLRPGLTLRI